MIRNLKNRSFNKATFALKGTSPFISYIFNGNQGLGFGGGGGGGYTAAANKMTFSTDTWAAQSSANMTATAGGAGSWGNKTTGIISQIGNANASKVTNKVAFSTLVTSLNAAQLNVGRAGGNGSGNSSFAYFFGGGDANQVPANVDSTEKFTFSTSLFSNVASSKLATKTIYHGAFASNDASYVLGGGTGQYGNTPSARAEKLPFATETIANVSGVNLPVVKARGAFGQYYMDKGYYVAGNNGGIVNTAYKTTFTTDVTSAMGSNTLYALHDLSATWSTNKMYAYGGYDSGWSNKTQVMTLEVETWVAAGNYMAAVTVPTSLA